MGQAKSRSRATSTVITDTGSTGGTAHDLEEEEWIRFIHEAGVGVGNDHPDNRLYKYGNPSKKLNQSQLAALKTFIEECERLGVYGLIAEFNRELLNWQPWTGRAFCQRTQAHYANLERNRYIEIYCLDETRVVLREPNRAHDYINANVVRNTPFLNKYICAMAPIKSTIEDFWAMVVQEHVAYIFLLCDPNTSLCDIYYPTLIGQAMNFGDIRVKCKKVQYTSNETVMTKLSVKSMSDNFKKIIVHHYHWTNWNVFGTVPISAEPALQLLKLVRDYEMQPRRMKSCAAVGGISVLQSRASDLATLIHCSNGGGRTGTLIAAEYIIELIMQGKKVELVEVVKDIRRQRAFLIETGMQYCYVVLILYRFYTEATRVGSSDKETPEDKGYLKFCTEMNAVDNEKPRWN